MDRISEDKRKKIFFLGIIFFLMPFTFTPNLYAKERVILDLKQCIKMAVETSPEIGESRYERDVYIAKKQQADSGVYPQIEATALIAPSPRAKKEHLTPDIKTSVGTTINGIFGGIDITLIQPVYTFGKITGYKEAASRGVNIANAGIYKTTADIILRVKELYYGLLLAKDMRKLLLETRDELIESIKKAEKHIELDSPWADEVNLFKLRAFLGEVEKYLNETDKNISIAKDGLITMTNLPRDVEFDIADESLTPEDAPIDNIINYIKHAHQFRPEIIQINEGLLARQALINVERSNLYPHFFIGLKASIAGATNRDKIDNPYIFDYFNHTSGAIFGGLKWTFDFGITNGRIKESEAQYKSLLEKKRFVDEAIPFQIRRSFLDNEESKKNIEETERAYKNARKWLISAIANFDIGIGDAKEIGDAALSYIRLKAEYLRSVYNNRISYANILHASGMSYKELIK